MLLALRHSIKHYGICFYYTEKNSWHSAFFQGLTLRLHLFVVHDSCLLLADYHLVILQKIRCEVECKSRTAGNRRLDYLDSLVQSASSNSFLVAETRVDKRG